MVLSLLQNYLWYHYQLWITMSSSDIGHYSVEPLALDYSCGALCHSSCLGLSSQFGYEGWKVLELWINYEGPHWQEHVNRIMKCCRIYCVSSVSNRLPRISAALLKNRYSRLLIVSSCNNSVTRSFFVDIMFIIEAKVVVFSAYDLIGRRVDATMTLRRIPQICSQTRPSLKEASRISTWMAQHFLAVSQDGVYINVHCPTRVRGLKVILIATWRPCWWFSAHGEDRKLCLLAAHIIIVNVISQMELSTVLYWA